MHDECFTLNGWKILAKLKVLFNSHDAILAGETALALRIGHRISEDLDFFTNKEFRIESAISAIRKKCDSFSVISEGEDFLTVNADSVKVSIFKYDYPFIEKIDTYKGIKIAGLLDIASMKVLAINQRGTKRDFIDLYFILQDVPFHKIADNIARRYGKERINPVHMGKSFVYFSDAESNPEPQYMKRKAVHWDKIKFFFRTHVKQFVFDLDSSLKL